MTKHDPSFKSKKYRDKLRQEIRELESILPVERSHLQRRLDSQTIFRLSIAFLRTKQFVQGLEPHKLIDEQTKITDQHAHEQFLEQLLYIEKSISSDLLLQAMDGFIMVLTSDGTMLYVSSNILQHLGFNQVDVMLRCVYGIIHPDDHRELKSVLEGQGGNQQNTLQNLPSNMNDDNIVNKNVSFICRMKCFSGTSTGFLKMQCCGQVKSFPHVTKSTRTTNDLLFALFRPFISVQNSIEKTKNVCFWSKHDLDLKFRQIDPTIDEVLEYKVTELEGTTLYKFIHPEDLHTFTQCHKALVYTEDIQSLYFRLQHSDGSWLWFHTRGKLVLKNAKKYSLVFNHSHVREEDSTFLQQESISRQRHGLQSLMFGIVDRVHNADKHNNPSVSTPDDLLLSRSDNLPGFCPSSWHTSPDRHSPVFPNHHQYREASRKTSTSNNKAQHARFKPYPNKSSNSCYSTALHYPAIQGQVSNHASVIHGRYYRVWVDGIGYTAQRHPEQFCNEQYGDRNSDYASIFFQGHLTAVESPGFDQNTINQHNTDFAPTYSSGVSSRGVEQWNSSPSYFASSSFTGQYAENGTCLNDHPYWAAQQSMDTESSSKAPIYSHGNTDYPALHADKTPVFMSSHLNDPHTETEEKSWVKIKQETDPYLTFDHSNRSSCRFAKSQPLSTS